MLNLAGKAILVQSPVTSFPICTIQTCWLSNSICSSFNKMFRGFIRSNRKGKRVHILGWDQVSLLVYHRVLRVHMARENNIFMLEKLSWGILIGKIRCGWICFLLRTYMIGNIYYVVIYCFAFVHRFVISHAICRIEQMSNHEKT